MAKAIFVTGTPLSLFEHPLWIEFFKKIRPSFKLASRKVVSTSLLEKQYAIMESEVTQKLTEASNLNLQCDGWSNCRNESIINFMISYPSPLFVKFLETKDDSHDANYLCTQMEEVILKYGPEKFLVAIGDNAPNMKAGLEQLQEKYPHIVVLGCVSHLMHLLFGDIMKCQSAKRPVAVATTIIKKVKRSHKLGALFSKIQKEKSINISLKLPGKTRWGSILFALKSLSANRNVLQILVVNDAVKDKFTSNMRKKILDDEFWSKVDILINIFTPITSVNIALEGDGVLIHKVHTRLNDLKHKINAIVQTGCSNMFTSNEKKQILENLQKRKDFATHSIHMAAALLDPANRGSDLNTNEMIDAMEFVVKTATNMSLEASTVLCEIGNYKNKEDIWNKSFVWTTVNNLCPMQWWKTFYSQTLLSKIAVRILSAPISSASTERSNSTFGWIHSNKRNRLTTQRAGKITYLAQNWKLLDPKTKKSNTNKRSNATTSADSIENDSDSDLSSIHSESGSSSSETIISSDDTMA